MREEKKILTAQYVARLNASPYFIMADYTGLSVADFEELRGRLAAAGAEIHVVKNRAFKIAAGEAGLDGLNGSMRGQLALVTGAGEITVVAKAVKKFFREFAKLEMRFGYLDGEWLDAAAVNRLADLPTRDGLRAQLAGLIREPAARLARVINTPATQIARALQARVEKEQG